MNETLFSVTVTTCLNGDPDREQAYDIENVTKYYLDATTNFFVFENKDGGKNWFRADIVTMIDTTPIPLI